MGLANPDTQADFRARKVTYLNLTLRMCKGPCKSRRSPGQYNLDPDLCDQCFKRKPKAA